MVAVFRFGQVVLVLSEFVIFLNYVANVASYLCNLCISPTLTLVDYVAMSTSNFTLYVIYLSVYMWLVSAL